MADTLMNGTTRFKLLLIAFHFPPIQGSTGAIRTVSFAKYLRAYGWDVEILTIKQSAYESVSAANNLLVPDHINVTRAWGFDTRKSLSILGRYLTVLALPDRWQSWVLGGYRAGSRIVSKWKPDVIMSTYPICSAHLIGYLLSKRYSIPWVTEFRDPMLQVDYPKLKIERRVYAKIEKLMATSASEIVVATNGCRKLYLERFPALDGKRITTISNGYDPHVFKKPASRPSQATLNRMVLLHSGVLYTDERDPTHFFHAVHLLKNRNFFQSIDVEFRFRAPGHLEKYTDIVQKLGIDSIVTLLPSIPYAEAIEEMQSSDALMLFQASNCNNQIPAKVYEYFYCRRPVLAFTDPKGDTGQLLRSVGLFDIARLDDSAEIANLLENFLVKLRTGDAFVVSQHQTAQFSRKALTAHLSQVLLRACGRAQSPSKILQNPRDL